MQTKEYKLLARAIANAALDIEASPRRQWKGHAMDGLHIAQRHLMVELLASNQRFDGAKFTAEIARLVAQR